MREWTQWKSMPAPDYCRLIDGPSGPGVYQIRNATSGELILFGESKHCQKRMKSFFPKPYGTGTRNNEAKRNYVLNNWQELQYRTLQTTLKSDAVNIDRQLKSQKNHLFNS